MGVRLSLGGRGTAVPRRGPVARGQRMGYDGEGGVERLAAEQVVARPDHTVPDLSLQRLVAHQGVVARGVALDDLLRAEDPVVDYELVHDRLGAGGKSLDIANEERSVLSVPHKVRCRVPAARAPRAASAHPYPG